MDENNTFNSSLLLIQRLLSPTDHQDNEDEINLKVRKNATKLRERFMDKEKQTDTLVAHFTEVNKKIDSVSLSINKLKSTIELLNKQLETQPPSNSFSNEFEKSSLHQLQQICALHERAFGLCIERTHSNLLQLKFYGCAPPSTTSYCCCQLRLSRGAQHRFELISSNPPIPDMDRLIHHLNWTNDLRSFVIVLRQRFCRYFQLVKLGQKAVPTDD